MVSLLRLALTGLAGSLVFTPALAEAPALTVQGEGSATKKGIGQVTATLPDGSECSASFSGGKISLLGESAAKGVGTCRNGERFEAIRVVVSRRLNGTPRQATLTFNDGTRVTVEIPREAAQSTREPYAPALDADNDEPKPPPLPEVDLDDVLEQLPSPALPDE